MIPISIHKMNHKRQRDCIWDHDDLPSSMNGVCDCETEPVQMKDVGTQTMDNYTPSGYDVPRCVERFITRDVEIYTLQKRINELKQFHEDDYTSDESVMQLPRNTRHGWWMFMVNDHGKKDDIDHFLHHFSSKWIYQYETEHQSDRKYVIGVFQADSTRYKNGLQWSDISQYYPSIANWFHYVKNKKAALSFCQKSHNRIGGPFSQNISIDSL